MSSNGTTESVNGFTRDIDQCTTMEILERINQEDHKVAEVVKASLPEIEKAVDCVTRSLSSSGRLIYVGAGTSGRIGMIDAVECLPTYGISGDRIMALIAGGCSSMYRAQEQAEDDFESGRREIEALNVNAHDTVIGLSASGSTPFVSGALLGAKSHFASTVAIICNASGSNLENADIGICLRTGAEVICGSTRMKAATAQKMTVNMISTTAMIRLGRVIGNFMVEINPKNEKLRSRACFIAGELCGIPAKSAKILLEQNEWKLRKVIEEYGKGRRLRKSKA